MYAADHTAAYSGRHPENNRDAFDGSTYGVGIDGSDPVNSGYDPVLLSAGICRLFRGEAF